MATLIARSSQRTCVLRFRGARYYAGSPGFIGAIGLRLASLGLFGFAPERALTRYYVFYHVSTFRSLCVGGARAFSLLSPGH
jgi:hypothetical protein